MNYIVMDLEWNQSPDGKFNSVPQMPFEIVQIGAVRLDDNLNETGQFSRLIRPKVYTRFHKKVQEILTYDMDYVNKNGADFQEVISEFLEWCGNDCVFCTWGSGDLTELQRNMAYFNIEYNFPYPFLFYDLQKLYSISYSDGKTRVTLQKAIQELEIEQKEEYHMADSDARYTAQIIRHIDMNRVRDYYSVDTYRYPKNRKEEIYINFKEYGKYISKGFATKENGAKDREVRSARCFICNSNMKRIVKWFATNTKTYYGLFQCEEHGLIKGRFKFKTADDNKCYAIKIMKLTDNNGAEKIMERQKKEREHRRARRKALAANQI